MRNSHLRMSLRMRPSGRANGNQRRPIAEEWMRAGRYTRLLPVKIVFRIRSGCGVTMWDLLRIAISRMRDIYRFGFRCRPEGYAKRRIPMQLRTARAFFGGGFGRDITGHPRPKSVRNSNHTADRPVDFREGRQGRSANFAIWSISILY